MSRTGTRRGVVKASTPKIVSDVLYSDDNFTGARVGSEQWFTWLNTARTFYYEGKEGTFTARCEVRERGGEYWTAYRQYAGKLRKSYMGKPEALTPEKLAEIAKKLAVK